MIKDAGNCSYGKPEYRNYFFQSDAHNVVKFNSKGQSTYQQYHGTLLPGSLSGMVAGDRVRYLMADATGPTADNFARNQRHYLWIGSVLLVIDDLKTHEAGQFEWLWHPGGETRKVGGDLVVTNGDASAIIRPLYPQPLAPSNYVHDYPEMLYWDVLQGPTEDLRGTEDYYSLKLPGQHDRIKAVTAIILKDGPDQRELPTIEKREGKDWIGLRITEGGKTTDVYINQLADGRLMHLNSWIEADGWSTDAYLLAVSPDEQLIVYGSALRRDGLTHFSSLSKLNLLAERSGTALSLHATRQPRLHFSLRPASRPS
ncbi:MAG: heparinase II/III-family protein, partial [Bacteroidales bacterium]|nr:heparinase II/III-family protein [Bacteroidales bacterium]